MFGDFNLRLLLESLLLFAVFWTRVFAFHFAGPQLQLVQQSLKDKFPETLQSFRTTLSSSILLKIHNTRKLKEREKSAIRLGWSAFYVWSSIIHVDILESNRHILSCQFTSGPRQVWECWRQEFGPLLSVVTTHYTVLYWGRAASTAHRPTTISRQRQVATRPGRPPWP